MIDSYVLDASVLTKWFIEEKDTEMANKIREDYVTGKISLIAPSLLYYEVLNALKYTLKFDETELSIIGESLESYGILLSNIADKARKKMIEIAINHDMTIYDAAYVALSIEENIKLITADRKIKEKLPKRYKNSVVDITEY